MPPVPRVIRIERPAGPVDAARCLGQVKPELLSGYECVARIAKVAGVVVDVLAAVRERLDMIDHSGDGHAAMVTTALA